MAVHAAPRPRSGMDEGGLPAHPQGWCLRYRWCDGGRVCAEPGDQSFGSPGTHQVRPLLRAAGPAVYIPKGDGAGSLRPLGLPTFEDKVAQRAIVMVLEAIYGQDFSHGFRPGRSAHQALHALRSGFMSHGLRWVIDPRYRKIFRFDFALAPACVCRQTSYRWCHA
jgi:hypothetical protein